MQLSGSAAQEELERFADVRAAALPLPVHSHTLNHAVLANCDLRPMHGPAKDLC